jgi:DNA-binding NtrC family response regulator
LSSAAPSSDILLVDDDPTCRDVIAKALAQGGHTCSTAQSGAQALQAMQQRAFDLLLLEARLPDTDGFRLLEALRTRGLRVPTIMLTARPSAAGAVRALHHQVNELLTKPVKSEVLLERVDGALGAEDLSLEYVWRSLEAEHGLHRVVSLNPRTRTVYLTAARVASSRAPVLLQGESGTGKEFLARDLHLLSDRAAGPFVVLNCGALPEDLLESELFGHEKGAFTSAGATKLGLCELADGGTLFLDEIGDMSPRMQVKLLRFLQDGSFRRLGGTEERQVSVRLVAATNQDLAAALEEKRFREDLYWRISVLPLDLPPLRERPEDLLPFSEYFLGQFAEELKRGPWQLDRSALQYLRQCPWPGNLRQMHNVLLRGALLSSGPQLTAGDLTLG